MNNLQYNKFVYDLLRKQVIKALRSDSKANAIALKTSAMANFAWRKFPGILADSKLESDLVKQLNSSLDSEEVRISIESQNDIILHYASAIYKIGGHTRVIYNWVKNDQYRSALYVRRPDTKIPSFLADCDLDVYVENEKGVEKQLKNILKLVGNVRPRAIILHCNPDDPLPLFIKSKLIGIPIIFFNHADFVFSLNSTIADYGISFFETSKRINDDLRFKYPSFVLPLYVDIQDEEYSRNQDENNQLKIVIMSSYYKTIPINEWNIYNLIERILQHERVGEINIIGITESQASKHCDVNSILGANFLGHVNNPKSILESSDIFIEPFPLGTGLGTIEAIISGCYPVFCVTPFMIYPKGAALNFFPSRFSDEYLTVNTFDEYVNFTLSKITHFHKDHVIEFRDYIIDNHHKLWPIQLASIYERIFKGEHGKTTTPINIPLINQINFAQLAVVPTSIHDKKTI